MRSPPPPFLRKGEGEQDHAKTSHLPSAGIFLSLARPFPLAGPSGWLPAPYQRPYQRPSNGVWFVPPIPPKGVGTGRPLEGGPTAVALYPAGESSLSPGPFSEERTRRPPPPPQIELGENE
jgi:hypothetical protein